MLVLITRPVLFFIRDMCERICYERHLRCEIRYRHSFNIKEKDFDVFRHHDFMPKYLYHMKKKDRFIHFIRMPLKIIVSGYAYHLSGNENMECEEAYEGNFVERCRPISCTSGCNETQTPSLSRLEMEVNKFLTTVPEPVTKHGDILSNLTTEQGLLYEACWEFCNIANMMQTMKESQMLDSTQVLTIDLDTLIAEKERYEGIIDEFISFNISHMPKPEKTHLSSYTEDEKQRRLEFLIDHPIVSDVYTELSQKYAISRWSRNQS